MDNNTKSFIGRFVPLGLVLLVCAYMSVSVAAESILLVSAIEQAITRPPCKVYEYRPDRSELELVAELEAPGGTRLVLVAPKGDLVALWRYGVDSTGVPDRTSDLCVWRPTQRDEFTIFAIDFWAVGAGVLLARSDRPMEIVTKGYWPEKIPPVLIDVNSGEKQECPPTEVPWAQAVYQGQVQFSESGRINPNCSLHFSVDTESGNLVHTIGPKCYVTSDLLSPEALSYYKENRLSKGLLKCADERMAVFVFQSEQGPTSPWHIFLWEKRNDTWRYLPSPHSVLQVPVIQMHAGFLLWQDVDEESNPTGRYVFYDTEMKHVAEWETDRDTSILHVDSDRILFRRGLRLFQMENWQDESLRGSKMLLEDRRLGYVHWARIVDRDR